MAIDISDEENANPRADGGIIDVVTTNSIWFSRVDAERVWYTDSLINGLLEILCPDD
jgi:hypothetical protein